MSVFEIKHTVLCCTIIAMLTRAGIVRLEDRKKSGRGAKSHMIVTNDPRFSAVYENPEGVCNCITVPDQARAKLIEVNLI